MLTNYYQGELLVLGQTKHQKNQSPEAERSRGFFVEAVSGRQSAFNNQKRADC